MLPPTNDIASDTQVHKDLFLCGRIMMTALLHNDSIIAPWDPVVYAYCLKSTNVPFTEAEAFFHPLKTLLNPPEGDSEDTKQSELVTFLQQSSSQETKPSTCLTKAFTIRSLAYNALRAGFQYRNEVAIAGYNTFHQVDEVELYENLRDRLRGMLSLDASQIEIRIPVEVEGKSLDSFLIEDKSNFFSRYTTSSSGLRYNQSCTHRIEFRGIEDCSFCLDWEKNSTQKIDCGYSTQPSSYHSISNLLESSYFEFRNVC